jgi:hypothetical protein
VHAPDELLPAAIELGSRLAAHSGEYVRRLTASLRAASGGATHAQLLEHETAAQKWSLSQPEFLASVRRIRARLAGTS